MNRADSPARSIIVPDSGVDEMRIIERPSAAQGASVFQSASSEFPRRSSRTGNSNIRGQLRATVLEVKRQVSRVPRYTHRLSARDLMRSQRADASISNQPS
jgi:hypothetical protein